MTSQSILPARSLTLWLSLPLAFTSAAVGQDGIDHPFYIGSGYAREISENEGVIRWAGFFDAGGDGILELASLHQDGTLTVHERFATYDTRLEVSGCAEAAVLAGNDGRLFAVQEDKLVELTRSTQEPAWEAVTLPGLGLEGITGLIGVDRGAESALLVIDKSGDRVVTLEPGEPWVSHALYVDPADAPILDAELLDWDGDGATDVALVTAGGLRVFDGEGASLLVQHVPADRAFVDVLKAEDTAGDRDYLLHHHRVAAGAPAVLDVVHASHFQQIYTDPLLLESAVVADFTAAEHSEVLLPAGFDQSVILLEQNYAAPGAPMVLVVNQDGVQVIDLDPLNALPPGDPDLAPAVAIVDIDGDGDEDAFFADQRGLGFVVTSSWYDEEKRMSYPEIDPYYDGSNFNTIIGQGGDTAHVYAPTLKVPVGADEIEVEVWYLASIESSGPGTLLSSPTFQTLGQSTISVSIVFSEFTSPDGVCYFLFRPTSTDSSLARFPTTAFGWSSDANVLNDLKNYSSGMYLWPLALGNGGTGGTTQRPVVPGPPVPPTPSGG